MHNRNREYLCDEKAESLRFRMKPPKMGEGYCTPLGGKGESTMSNPLDLSVK